MADGTTNEFGNFWEAFSRVISEGTGWLKEKLEWLGTEGKELEEELEPVFENLERVAWWAMRWPFILLALALIISQVFSPRWTRNLLPIVAMMPLFLVMHLITTRAKLMVAIAAIKTTPTTTKYIGGLIKILRGVIDGLFLVLGGELAIGAFLAFAPIHNDPWLMPGFMLCIGTGVCFVISGHPKFANFFWLAAIACVLIWLAGGRDKVPTTPEALVDDVKSTVQRFTPKNKPSDKLSASVQDKKDFGTTPASCGKDFDMSHQTFAKGDDFQVRLGACSQTVILPNMSKWDVNGYQSQLGDWAVITCGGRSTRWDPLVDHETGDLPCGGAMTMVVYGVGTLNFAFQKNGL